MAQAALSASEFRDVVTRNASLQRIESDPRRRACLDRVLDRAATLVPAGARSVADELPAAIGQAMESFGWAWNGFYVARGEGELALAQAFGPPVCTPLMRRGGIMTSGMCFDALALNQTLVAYEPHSWPGSVSCDDTSGLTTVANIVTPIRSPGGVPIAVWDLDATSPVRPSDVRVMDVLFATLARTVAFSTSAFAAGSMKQ